MMDRFCDRPGRPAAKGMHLRMAIKGVAVAVLFALVFGFFVRLLWNWLMPDLFLLSPITYWQAFGIMLLAKLIFGSPAGPMGREKPPPPRHWDEHAREHFVQYGKWWDQEGKAAFKRYCEKEEQPRENPSDEQTHA